jgi:hypothetical protein
MFIDPASSPRLVEEKMPDDYRGSPQSRRFVLYYGQARVWYVHVTPHGPWWWKLSASQTLVPSARAFDMAKRYWDSNHAEQKAELESIIRDYPNSEASRRAQSLLEELQSREQRK